jgi:hypothetical protein
MAKRQLAVHQQVAALPTRPVASIQLSNELSLRQSFCMLFFLGGNEECFWDGKGNNISAHPTPQHARLATSQTTHPDAWHRAPSINLYLERI